MSDQDDFARLLDASFTQLKRGFKPGEKVRGTVASITTKDVLVDLHAKSEGVIERHLLEVDGQLSVKVGDAIEAYFVGMDGSDLKLAPQLSQNSVDDSNLQQAAEGRIPVIGKVTGATASGLEVTIGKTRGFCPISQIDTGRTEDTSGFVGMVLTFLVLEYEERNLLLSRRMFLEMEQAGKREQLEQALKVGDVVPGTVARILDFGVFVSLGGVDGLVPINELSYDRGVDPNTIVKVGDSVQVRILALDWPKKRITLSVKQAGADPWQSLEGQFMVGMAYPGKITRLMDFGAFVQLAPGIEGLIHISKLGGGKRIGHPRDVVHEGQQLDVYVDAIDTERKRLSLSLENPQTGRKVEVQGQDIIIGAQLTGTVAELRPFGVFVKLNAKQTGLLHVSELADDEGRQQGALQKRYPVGGPITVVVKGLKEGKISLGLPRDEGGREDFQTYAKEAKVRAESFGSLGSAFDGLKL